MSTMKRATSRTSSPPNLEPWAPRFRDGLHDPLGPLTAMAIDGAEREDKKLEHRIEIELTHYSSTGPRFRVTYRGETLIESARDPEHEACRALLAKGIKGKLVTYSPGSLVARGKIDIEKGAKMTVVENGKDGPRTARYRPHPGSTGQDDPE